jgi:uncharacterized protein (TIGR03083 family)
METELVGPKEIRAAVKAVSPILKPVSGDAGLWDSPAGQLEWSCREALAHVVNCLNRFAALLARCASGNVETPSAQPDAEPAILIDTLCSAGAMLAAVVEAADLDARGWHPYGLADRSGFAAMGCNEIVVHAMDIAGGLGVAYEPPRHLCDRVLRRLFPWAPLDVDPWTALLWANGRAPLGGRPPEKQWLWHCAPLKEWDGTIRRMNG